MLGCIGYFNFKQNVDTYVLLIVVSDWGVSQWNQVW